MASGDALFISELGPLPEMSPGIPGRGVSEVERHIMDKDTEEETSLLEAWKMYRVLLTELIHQLPLILSGL